MRDHHLVSTRLTASEIRESRGLRDAFVQSLSLSSMEIQLVELRSFLRFHFRGFIRRIRSSGVSLHFLCLERVKLGGLVGPQPRIHSFLCQISQIKGVSIALNLLALASCLHLSLLLQTFRVSLSIRALLGGL